MLRKIIFSILLTFILTSGLNVRAQEPPCNPPGSCESIRDLPSIDPTGGTSIPVPDAPTPPVGSNQNFDTTKAQILQVLVVVVPNYLHTVEKLIVDNFWVYLSVLVGIAIILSLINYSLSSFDQNEDFLKWLIPAIFFLILLPMSGDLNGDGRPGDLIGMVRYSGMQIFYGYDNNGNINDSSFIAYPVKELRTYYNQAYGDFVNKAYTVKLPEGTVTLPGPTGLEQRLRVQFSKGYKLEDVQKGLDPTGWKMETLFEWMNGGRFVFEISDIIIMLLHAFCDFFLRVMLPFVLLLSIDPGIRQRIWGNFLYFLVMTSFVFPLVHQICRIICYSMFDIILSIRNVNPYYLFDATTQSIVQNSGADPTLLIFTLTLLSLFAVLAFGLGCPALTSAIASGNPFQWLVGTTSAGFTFASSVTLSYLTSSITGALSQEISESRAKTNLEVGNLGVLGNYYRASELAKGSYKAGAMGAQGYKDSAYENLRGSFVTGGINSYIEQTNQVGNSMISFDQAKGRSLINTFEHLSQAQSDWLKTNYGLNAKEMQSFLKANPEFMDMYGKTLEQIPVLGSTFGLGDIVRSAQNAGGLFDNTPAGDYIRKNFSGVHNGLGTLYSAGGNNLLENLKIFGTDSNNKFNGQLLGNNLYQAFEQMPGGEKVLGELGLDRSQMGSPVTVDLAQTMQNQPFQAPLKAVRGFETGSPMYNKIAQQARERPLSNPYQVYWHDSQKQQFRTTGDKQLDYEILVSAHRAGINPVAWRAQIFQESGGKQSAVSHKGAFGGAQLMPETAAKLRADAASVGARLDPHKRSDNILLGAMYYRQMADIMRVKGGYTDGRQLQKIALAAYNAGPGAVQKYGYRVPPYKETRDYVSIITGNYDRAMGSTVPNQQLSSAPNFMSSQGRPVLQNAPLAQPPMAQPNYAPSSTPVLVQPGQFNSNLNGLYNQFNYQLQGYGPSANKAAAELFANKLDVQAGRDTANFELAQRQTIAANVNQGEVALAGRAYEKQTEIAGWTRGMRDRVTTLTYQYGRSATDMQYNAQMKSLQTQLDSNLNVAGHDKDIGLLQQTKLYEQAMAEARMQAALQIISTVGNSASHQFEQMMEKTNSRY